MYEIIFFENVERVAKYSLVEYLAISTTKIATVYHTLDFVSYFDAYCIRRYRWLVVCDM